MKIFEAGYLSHQELNINWTVPFNEKTIIIVILMVKLVISKMSKSHVHEKSGS
jgi:hypothetical protein